MTIEEITASEYNRFTVDNWGSGIAFYALRVETVPDEDTEWSGYEVPTGNVIMVMVGDDREFSVDPEDVTELKEEVCSCGQIGCKANLI